MLEPNRTFKFKSNFLWGGSVLHPDMLEIDETFVIHRRKRGVFSGDQTVSIPRSNVVSVKINNFGAGNDICIESFTRSRIECKGFSTSVAEKVKKLLLVTRKAGQD
jgi:hypothetical protein